MKTHPYEKEVRSLLARIKKHGLEVYSVECDGYPEVMVETIDDAVEEILSVDTSYISMMVEDKSKWMFIVLGNEPGVIVSDYVCCDVFDTIVDDHYTQWLYE